MKLFSFLRQEKRRPGDRRQKRSADVQTAIAYQLAASAKRAHFSAMVLADDNGVVVADAGHKGACLQMAALAPALASNRRPWHGPVEIVEGEVRLTVAPLMLDETPFYLTAADGSQAHLITSEMAASREGIRRILA